MKVSAQQIEMGDIRTLITARNDVKQKINDLQFEAHTLEGKLKDELINGGYREFLKIDFTGLTRYINQR